MRRSMLVLPLLLAACAATPLETQRSADRAALSQGKLDAALAGLTPGETTDCLPITTRSEQTLGYGSTLLFKVSRGLIYRNDTGGGCEAVERRDILITVSPSGRLCRGDIARTVEPVAKFTTGSCTLGSFTKYSRR